MAATTQSWKEMQPRQKAAVIMMSLGGALLLCAAVFGVFPGGRAPAQEPLTAGQTGDEARLAATLSAIKGAGQVRVMITYDTAAPPEAAQALGDNAPGQQNIKGVLIVAEGAEDLFVRAALLQAAQTVLRVPANCVDVFVSG
ncbi:MAG: hypothetical protein FWD16_04630 [Clostridia bacterium]|nr:hypothetical protein [Clostridia bacterium]